MSKQPGSGTEPTAKKGVYRLPGDLMNNDIEGFIGRRSELEQDLAFVNTNKGQRKLYVEKYTPQICQFLTELIKSDPELGPTLILSNFDLRGQPLPNVALLTKFWDDCAHQNYPGLDMVVTGYARDSAREVTNNAWDFAEEVTAAALAKMTIENDGTLPFQNIEICSSLQVSFLPKSLTTIEGLVEFCCNGSPLKKLETSAKRVKCNECPNLWEVVQTGPEAELTECNKSPTIEIIRTTAREVNATDCYALKRIEAPNATNIDVSYYNLPEINNLAVEPDDEELDRPGCTTHFTVPEGCTILSNNRADSDKQFIATTEQRPGHALGALVVGQLTHSPGGGRGGN